MFEQNNFVVWFGSCNEWFVLTGGLRDCRIGEWGVWSPCSMSCGVGEMTRKREVVKHARHGGKPCPPLIETKWCGSAQDCSHRPYFNWQNSGFLIKNRIYRTSQMSEESQFSKCQFIVSGTRCTESDDVCKQTVVITILMLYIVYKMKVFKK